MMFKHWKQSIQARLEKAKFLAKEQQSIEKYGFHIRYVPQFYQFQYRLFPSVHTTGLTQNFQHPEVELVIPFPPPEAARFLAVLAHKIKSGQRYETNTLYNLSECCNLPFYFIPVHNPYTEEDCLRVILPDKLGYFPHQSKCNPTFSCQEQIHQLYHSTES